MVDIPNEPLLREVLKSSLEENLAMFRTIFNAPLNKDLIERAFEVCGFNAVLLYMEGMAGGSIINEGVLEPCLTAQTPQALQNADRADYLVARVLNISDTDLSDQIKELVKAILDGKSVLLLADCAQGIVLETRDYEKRNVERAQSESVVIGSQQGFVENLRTNITLIRRMVRSPMLITEMMPIGNQVPTGLALMYLKGVVNEKSLNEVRRRIRSLNVDYVSDSGQLQELIEDSTLLLIPQMLETERPDRTTHAIYDGQIAIMMDNSPFALIAPITFFHLFHAADDNYMRWQYGTFTRLLRLIGTVFSLFLPAIYVALTTFHAHMIPLDLLTSIAETRAKVPFPILVEVLFMEISFYMINEAGTRMPAQIGSALGIVGALILGQSAVAANIISPVLIIIVALTGLGNYVAPTYSLSIAMEILRLGMLLGGALMGLYGIVLVTFLYLSVLCGARSFGAPMMAPLAPYRPHNPDLILRLPLWIQKRILFIANRNSWLKRTPEEGPMRGWEEENP